jgi:hypothetical protein
MGISKNTLSQEERSFSFCAERKKKKIVPPDLLFLKATKEQTHVVASEAHRV